MLRPQSFPPVRAALALACFLIAIPSFAIDATEIVRKAEDLLRGRTSYFEMEMTIVKPDWSRTMGMKAWGLEPHYALVYLTEPARDKGTVTLKRGGEIWNWIPAVQKEIKIPPSMMLQSWMGSDFTNDDLVRESSVVDDYTHQLLGTDNLAGYPCWRILMIPKPEAGVVWGKIIVWISKEEYFELRADYYSEEGDLVKTFVGSNVRTIGGRTIPTHWEMIPVDKPGNKTVLDYMNAMFNPKNINEAFFSQQNMRKVR